MEKAFVCPKISQIKVCELIKAFQVYDKSMKQAK
jgi:hypothetical protein